ncbi:hypothetical protein LB105_005437, partial [Salmonella enterica]|nr:hypothetical protein [Salmonella enterica]
MFNEYRNSNFPIKDTSDANVNGSGSGNSLRYIPFALFPLVLAFFLSPNISYAINTEYGDGAMATGVESSAYGENAQAIGDYSTSTGRGAKATGYHSTATGVDARATGEFSAATGNGAKASGDYSTATGVGAQATVEDSTAIGMSAQATGDSSSAIGSYSQATGWNSTATGSSSQASGANSVALGAESVADQDNQVSIGQKITDAVTGAVSYITRTLSNVTDGTDIHDAVNKGQLDTAKADAIDAANANTATEIGKLDTKAQGYASTAKTEAVT